MNKIIGIMGPGESASNSDIAIAEKAGSFLASEGFIILTGGRNCGVMHAALKGAKKANGTTIGILPGETKENISEYVDIPVLTGVGQARNNINILTADIIIAIGLGPGTLSEIALAIKHKKKVIVINYSTETMNFFKKEFKTCITFTNNIEELKGILTNL